MPNLVLMKWGGVMEVYKLTISTTNLAGQSVAVYARIPLTDELITYSATKGYNLNEWVFYDPNSNTYLPTWLSGDPSQSNAFGDVIFWTKTTLSSSTELWLVHAPDKATAYYDPSQIFDGYAVGDTSQFASTNVGTGASLTTSTQYYVSPDQSYELTGAGSTAPVSANVQFTVCDTFIVVSHFYAPSSASGHPAAGRTDTSWAGPYTWIGSTSPWAGAGTNIGYYDSAYHILGTYPTGKWNREWLVVHLSNGNFDFYLNGNSLGTGLSLIQGYDTWTLGSTGYIMISAVSGTVYYDDVLIACYPAEPDITTTTSGQVVTMGLPVEEGVSEPYDTK